eukprot:GHVU01024864.1.p1 GENE.GHVU01024864.1~~GHVU01024864.1.p1  ORF type:complete len:111 (+),score=5.89 GHVU01024864.1:840-1172(+)
MEGLWGQYSTIADEYINNASIGSYVSNDVLDHVSHHIENDALRVYLKYCRHVYKKEQSPDPKFLSSPTANAGFESGKASRPSAGIAAKVTSLRMPCSGNLHVDSSIVGLC